MCWNHFSLRKCLCITLWCHNLLHLTIDDIFSNLAKSKIWRINSPIIRPFFLLSWIIILMRFKIHLSYLFRLWHILSRIDSLFDIIFVLLCWNSIFKILLFRLLRHIVIASNSLSKRLPENESIYTFYVIYTYFRKLHLRNC